MEEEIHESPKILELPETLSPDTDALILQDFDEVTAREQLKSFDNCAQIVLSSELQADIGLQIGINLSAEHPWKQIKREILLDYLVDSRKEVMEFRKILNQMEPGELILVYYDPSLSEDQDTFVFFASEANAKEASALIQKLEANERRKAIEAVIKYPRRWKNFGSDKEIERTFRDVIIEMVDVEVQSIYPVDHTHKPFKLRLSSDVRDGYIELVPDKSELKNIIKKRVDVNVQIAPTVINLEQQTDPAFPANAWSQYLYEIVADDEEAKQEEKEEALRSKAKPGSLPPELPLPASDKMVELLKTLEFNEVDMYRNDYPYIAEKEVAKYTMPYFTEVFCFVNMSKSNGRYVCSLDWHPTLSGICVVAYAFSTPSSSRRIADKTDKVKQAVLSPNAVLMWSFDDTLQPKVELETPREITCLTFCPYDPDLLIGGAVNGQILLWDLKGALEKVETEEILTPAQLKYRTLMRMFLNWTQESNQDYIVRPAAIGAMETSQKGAICSIRWLDRQHYVAATGQIQKSQTEKGRFFMTLSLDGSVCFWDLDTAPTPEARKLIAQRRAKMPSFMLQEESMYGHLNRTFRPIFQLIYNHPLDSMVIDSAKVRYIPIDEPKNRRLNTRVKHTVEDIPVDEVRGQIIAASFLGGISILTWEGSEHLGGIDVKKEIIKQAQMFADIHDGPILKIAENPFLLKIYLTIGRNIVAVWKEENPTFPIYWRRRPYKLTDCKWSIRRPSVFFLCRVDGSIEAWDMISRIDKPCLVDSLGGSALTFLGQHVLPLPKETICIGDYNSSLRTLIVPAALTKPIPNEIELCENILDRELNRLKHIKKWQETYYASNNDIREARKRAAREAQAAQEKLDKEFKEKEEMRIRIEEEHKRKAEARTKKKNVFDLPERNQKKFDEMNMKRLMKVLMSMKMVDPELLAAWTKPEKDLIEYNKRKRKAIADSFRRITEEYQALRARLLPVVKPDESRLDFVTDMVKRLLAQDNDEECYRDIEENTLNYVHLHNVRQELTSSQILQRAHQRREVINKSLGSNTQHRHTYSKIKDARSIDEYNDFRHKAPSSHSFVDIPEIGEEEQEDIEEI